MSSHKSLVALVILLAVIIAASALFSQLNRSSSDAENLSTEEKKSLILEQSAQADSKPLSSEEKSEISKELGEGNSGQYRLTDEEKDAIIKALNKN